MTNACEEIRELLVDYADGELAAAEAEAVESHLETCTDCRQLLAALRKSLSLAEGVWQQRLADVGSAEPARPHPRSVWGWRTALQAACILLVVGAAYLLPRRPTSPSEPPEDGMSLAEIQRQVESEGMSAQLLAAINLLAPYPEARDIAAGQLRYIVERYPNTHSAKLADQRLRQQAKY